MIKLLAIALGGALGALARYGLTLAVQRESMRLPWGTLSVNLVGCFAIGLAGGWFAGRELDETWRAFLFIGLLGAFTTFSTYGYESVQLAAAGDWTRALLNVALANGVGLGAVWLGARAAVAAAAV